MKALRWLGRLALRLLLVVTLLLVLCVVPVAVHGVLDPQDTAFMIHARSKLRAAGDARPIQRRWVDARQIASAMRLAVVAAEDQKFPAHHGFDLEAMQKAFAHNQAGRRIRGGSTISQQVAKNLYLWPSRSYLRKGLEAWLTLLIETLWSKQRILEVYLNVAQFDADLFGVDAAAQRFFGKPAARLSAHEAALLAAVLPNPVRYRVATPSRYVRHRQQVILRHMRALGPQYLDAL